MLTQVLEAASIPVAGTGVLEGETAAWGMIRASNTPGFLKMC